MAESTRGTVVQCPECKSYVGPGAGVDVYKHAVSCFHLADQGVAQLLQVHRDKHDEFSRRVVQLLEQLEEKER